jgi:hypothetical protein
VAAGPDLGPFAADSDQQQQQQQQQQQRCLDEISQDSRDKSC